MTDSLPTESLADEASPSASELSRVIGRRVRDLRNELRMTMSAFAAAAGISLGMLSKIEHGQTAPSLSTLVSLADAAGVPFTALFRGFDEEHDLVMVRADERLRIIHEGSGPGRIYEDLGSLRGPNRVIEPMITRITEKDVVFPLFQHRGIELIHILEGRLEYGYGGSSYVLGPGDTIHIHGEVAHGPTEIIEVPVEFLSLKVYPNQPVE